MRIPSKLPNTLWECFKLACEHVERFEKNPELGVKIDMDIWYNYQTTCKVCLAGAVMKAEFDLYGPSFYPFDFEECAKFHALNSVRMGDLVSALVLFYDLDSVDISAEFDTLCNRANEVYEQSNRRSCHWDLKDEIIEALKIEEAKIAENIK